MLKQLKTTFIVLVPKWEHAYTPNKYRPISLTNEFYEIISGILMYQMKSIIPKIVGRLLLSQVEGFLIVSFLLWTFFLAFTLKKGASRMCIKLDLAKAYDSVRWEFLEAALVFMHFSTHFIRLPMACVCHPCYSILLNGTSAGFFQGTRGLRHGSPLSPFLFAIVMDFFSSMMQRCATFGLISTTFVEGPVAISHIMFADDLIIFSRATPYATYNLKVLSDFHRFWSCSELEQEFHFIC